MSDIHSGSCLCGAVKLEGRGTPRIDVCHCGTCRHWHGSPGMAVEFSGGVSIVAGEDVIKVYDSSDWAERGFCSICGSTLFYRLKSKPEEHSAQAGLFDLPPGLKIDEHIFIDEKPDYYDFTGDAPRLTGAETFAKYADPDTPAD